MNSKKIKTAYSTKHEKYLNNEKCMGHDSLQCLNSLCVNEFSTTYHNNYIYNRSSSASQRSSSIRDYMEMYQLQN